MQSQAWTIQLPGSARLSFRSRTAQRIASERQADAVPEFHGVESEVENFLNHRGAIGMAS